VDIETLKHLALLGALHGQIRVSSSALASLLLSSPQTASRRLYSLEEKGCIERKVTGPGQRIRITEIGRLLLLSEYQDYRNIFERKRSTVMQGRVVGGLGEGQYYISREGYRNQFFKKLGFVPFPGTLNIKLDEPFNPGPHQVLIEGFREKERTYGGCRCYRIKINGQEGAIIRPDRSSYPLDLVEVISPLRLRDALKLKDGDEVRLTLL